MTWLTLDSTATDDWDAIRALSPQGVEALLDLQRAVWDHADSVLLELCRLRLAQLIGFPAYAELRSERARQAGLTDETIAELRRWPTSARFGDRERACLELTEQFLVDVNGITDDQVHLVLTHMSVRECFTLVQAMWVFEQFQRFCLVLGIEPTREAAGLT